MKMTLTMTMTWNVAEGDEDTAKDLVDDVDRDTVYGYFGDAVYGNREFYNFVATAVIVEE